MIKFVGTYTPQNITFNADGTAITKVTQRITSKLDNYVSMPKYNWQTVSLPVEMIRIDGNMSNLGSGSNAVYNVSIEVKIQTLAPLIRGMDASTAFRTGLASCMAYLNSINKSGSYQITDFSNINWDNAYVMAVQLQRTGQTWLNPIRLSFPISIPNQVSFLNGGGGIIDQGDLPLRGMNPKPGY